MLPLSQFVTTNPNQWLEQSTSFSARVNLSYVLTSSLTVFLPSVAKIGDSINFILPASPSTLTITINNSGLKLLGQSSNYLWYSSTINSQKDTLIYISGITGWVFNSQLVSNQINPINISSSITTLSYVGAGDNNDLFYVLGSANRRNTWANPYNALIDILALNAPPGSLVYSDVSNIINGNFYSGGYTNDWICIDIAKASINRKIRPSTLIIFTRNSADYCLRSFSVQGTNSVATFDSTGINAATWTNIKTYTNDTRMATIAGNPAVYAFTTDESITFFRYLRLYQTGVNSSGTWHLGIGKLLLYGDVINL